MKAGIFIGLIFFLLFLEISQLAMSQEETFERTKKVIDYQNPQTETITCLFKNSEEKDKCYNYFINEGLICQDEKCVKGKAEFLSSEGGLLLNNCEGISQCSINVKGEYGTLLRWQSLCNEKKPSGDNINEEWAFGYTTVIDGIDETIGFDCERPFFLFELIASGYDKLVETGLSVIYRNKIGYRDFHYLCQDGFGETFNGNESTPCKSSRELFLETENICNNHCIGPDEDRTCGIIIGGANEICIMDNPIEEELPQEKEVPCQDECSQAGLNQCSSDNLGIETCGNLFDNDACLEWGGKINCNQGMVCQNGECIKEGEIEIIDEPLNIAESEITSESYVFVFTYGGIPLPNKTINLFCNEIKSNITSWADREASKYQKNRPFNNIVCLKNQILLPDNLLKGGETIFAEGQIITLPLNESGIIEFLENNNPEILTSKYVAVIYYSSDYVQSVNHVFSPKYNFDFIAGTPYQGALQEIYLQPEYSVSRYSKTLTHELIHQVGYFAKGKYTTDKYDGLEQACLINLETGLEYSGYDIMCHRIPVLDGSGTYIEPNFQDLIISEPTAKEIGLLE